MNHQMNIDEAIAIAKEYHLEAEVTECIKQGQNQQCYLDLIIFIVTKQKTSAVKTGIFSFNLIVVGTYTLNLQIL